MNCKRRIPVLFVNEVVTRRSHGTWVIGKTVIQVFQFACVVLGPKCKYDHIIFKDCSDFKVLVVLSNGYSCAITLSTPNRNAQMSLKQLKIVSCSRRRLAAAKKLVKYRNTYIPRHLRPLSVCKTITLQELMRIEAIWTKNAYKRISRNFGQIWISKEIEHKRNFAFTYQNRVLYLLAYIAINHLGLDPNIGIIHNNRGFGLVYDLADIFKARYNWWITLRDDKKIINEKIVIKQMVAVLEDLFCNRY